MDWEEGEVRGGEEGRDGGSGGFTGLRERGCREVQGFLSSHVRVAKTQNRMKQTQKNKEITAKHHKNKTHKKNTKKRNKQKLGPPPPWTKTPNVPLGWKWGITRDNRLGCNPNKTPVKPTRSFSKAAKTLRKYNNSLPLPPSLPL